MWQLTVYRIKKKEKKKQRQRTCPITVGRWDKCEKKKTRIKKRPEIWRFRWRHSRVLSVSPHHADPCSRSSLTSLYCVRWGVAAAFGVLAQAYQVELLQAKPLCGSATTVWAADDSPSRTPFWDPGEPLSLALCSTSISLHIFNIFNILDNVLQCSNSTFLSGMAIKAAATTPNSLTSSR